MLAPGLGQRPAQLLESFEVSADRLAEIRKLALLVCEHIAGHDERLGTPMPLPEELREAQRSAA